MAVDSDPPVAHGVGKEQKRSVHVAADLHSADSGPDHLLVRSEHAAHDDVVLADESRVERLVEKVVSALGRKRAGPGDVDSHRADVRVDDLPLEDGLRRRINHPRRHRDPPARELCGDHGAQEVVVEQPHEAADHRLASVLRAEGRELPEQQRVGDDVDLSAVSVLDLRGAKRDVVVSAVSHGAGGYSHVRAD